MKDKNLAITKFLPLVLNTITPNYVVKVANPKLMNNVMAEIQFPLPPLDIQQKIVAECEKVDEEYTHAQKTIEENKQKIEKVFERLNVIAKQENGIKLRLSDASIFDISIGRRVLNSEVNLNYTIPVYSVNVFEPFGMIDTLLIEDFSVPSIFMGN